MDYNSMTFDKIGYINPDSNSRTDYQCREYKRIAIAENCTYLKLVFQKNINNIYNPFNQVALINLQCFGFIFSDNNLQEIIKDKFHKDNQNIYNNPEKFDELLKKENFDKYIPVPEIKDDQFHQICSDKLKDLNKNLERAKIYADYETAKTIQDFIEQVRIIGYKVEHLTKLKRIAVDKEDYLKAKELKNEIEKILGYVNEINQNYYKLPTPRTNHEPPEKKISNVKSTPEHSMNEDIKNYKELEEVPGGKDGKESTKGEKMVTSSMESEENKEEKEEQDDKKDEEGTSEEKENKNKISSSEDDSVREVLKDQLMYD
jgi:Asp-tRNA(Asn)/Glu-tRNA(Gln) amidotransferase C subunit